jgi:flagellar basal body rod protein FlgB
MGGVELKKRKAIIPKNNNVDINIDLLLHGNILFSYDLNTEIFQVVHKFISDTHRFI